MRESIRIWVPSIFKHIIAKLILTAENKYKDKFQDKYISTKI